MSVDTVFPKTPSRLRRFSRLKKLIIVMAAIVALYAILGFLVVPPIVKSVLVKQMTERLHRQADIREVKINPFLLTVAVHGLSLK
jgi:predicted PurR-regulated permease PerM